MKNRLRLLVLRTWETKQKMKEVRVFPPTWTSTSTLGPLVVPWVPPLKSLKVLGPKPILLRPQLTETAVARVSLSSKRLQLTTTRTVGRHWSPTVTTHYQMRRNCGWDLGTTCTYQWQNSDWPCWKIDPPFLVVFHSLSSVFFLGHKNVCLSWISSNHRWVIALIVTFYLVLIC